MSRSVSTAAGRKVQSRHIRNREERPRLPAAGNRRPCLDPIVHRPGAEVAVLWEFDDAAACVVDAPAVVIGGGSTIAVASLVPPRQSTGQFNKRWAALGRGCSAEA